MSTARTAQTEAQLAAMANTADRANRPRVLVVVGGLIALAAVLLITVRFFGFVQARSLLEQRLTEAASVQKNIEASAELRSNTTDLSAIFPDNPSMADRIEAIAGEVWGDEVGSLISIGVINYGNAVFQGDTKLKRADVRCTFGMLRTEQILEWVERVLNDPSLAGVFISQFDIGPSGPGEWRGTITFRMYVYRENSG